MYSLVISANVENLNFSQDLLSCMVGRCGNNLSGGKGHHHYWELVQHWDDTKLRGVRVQLDKRFNSMATRVGMQLSVLMRENAYLILSRY